jgi:hypothetical protein
MGTLKNSNIPIKVINAVNILAVSATGVWKYPDVKSMVA